MSYRNIFIALLCFLALLTKNVIYAQLPIIPEKVGIITELEITRIKPGHWPLNPFKCWAMKKRGEKPEPIVGPTYKIIIKGTIKQLAK